MWFQNFQYDPERPKLNYKDGVLTMSGICIPNDPDISFFEIISELQRYQTHGGHLVINFKFDYINTGTTKQIVRIINILNEIEKTNEKKDKKDKRQVSVNWLYYEMDEKIEELGEFYRDMAKFKFNLKSYKYE